MANPRMLTVIGLVVAIIVGGILVLSTNSWWLLPVPLILHGAGTAVVYLFIGRRLQQGDKPDPVTEAHAEAGDPLPNSRRDGTEPGRREDREIII
jgi:hypothetical protein